MRSKKPLTTFALMSTQTLPLIISQDEHQNMWSHLGNDDDETRELDVSTSTNEIHTKLRKQSVLESASTSTASSGVCGDWVSGE